MRKQRLLVTLLVLLSVSCTVVASTTPIIRFVRPKMTGDGTSWRKASNNIQAMIDTVAALGGGEVWVSEGVYKPTNVLNSTDGRDAAFLLRPGVKLYGGIDSHETEERLIMHCKRDRVRTVLTGDLVGDDTDDESIDYKTKDDNVYHVVLALAKENEQLFIDGFTISGGYADGIRHSDADLAYGISQTDGAGIYARSVEENLLSQVKILNCLVIGNKTLSTNASYGGGIYAVGRVEVINSKISNNKITAARAIGAGIYMKTTTVGMINGNSILKNEAVATSFSESSYGGGVYAEGAVTVVRNIIDENYVYSPSYAYGGGLFVIKSATILNNQIANNEVVSSSTKAYGGGVFATGFPENKVIMINNTIVENKIQGVLTKGSGIFNNGYASLYNSVVWANKNGDEERNNWDNEGEDIVIRNCLIQGVGKDNTTNNLDGLDTRNNLASLFTYEEGGQNKYMPKKGGLLVNTGDNSFYQNSEALTVALDLNKKARLSGSKIDIGAYEFQLSLETSADNIIKSDFKVYPTQTKDFVYFEKGDDVKAEVLIYSLAGNLVLKTVSSQADISGLPRGVYLVRLNNKVFKVSKL